MRVFFPTAIDSILCNRRRTFVTVAIIAVGVSALVGIQSALDVVSSRVTGSFDRIGASLCTIRPLPGAPPVTLRQASAVRHPDRTTIWSPRTSIARVRSGGRSTDPVVQVIACDHNYLACTGASVAKGRNFSPADVERRQTVAVIGDKLRRKLFDDASGVGEWISCEDGRFLVVGVISRQGALFGDNLDNSLLIPLDASPQGCFVSFRTSESAAAEISEAGRRMSIARRLPPGSEPDFEIAGADSSQAVLSSLRSKLSLAALAIGLITMLGAAVGLMNSMLVSVKERTRETGVRRALGAKARHIAQQFLLESVIIGQAGCAAGVILGMLMGWLVALGLDGDFAMPWRWVLFSVLLSLSVSLASGLLPARRAAALDPMTALRVT